LDLSNALERLAEEAPEAARLVREFNDRVQDLTIEDLQELYTRTFDLNPVCALEVGWQLYGDEYTRGRFLVFLRDSLRTHGIAEDTELPDHLVHVLPLLDRLDPSESRELTLEAVIPAADKMLEGFAGRNNAYEDLLRAIRSFLDTLSKPEREAVHA
jgi:nitrate reductase delta subunit